MLWKTLVARYGGRLTEQLDVSSLAKITDGYTPGHMAQAIQQILTERRVQQVCTAPVYYLLIAYADTFTGKIWPFTKLSTRVLAWAPLKEVRFSDHS